jgi:hypothetical protein
VTDKRQLRPGAGGRPRPLEAERAARARSAVVRSAFARPESGTATARVVWAPPAGLDIRSTAFAERAASLSGPIDITPGRPVPAAAPGGRRRLRAGLMIAAALGAVVAGGVAYAALAPDGSPAASPRPRVSLPAAPVPVLPAAGPQLTGVPGPRHGAAAPASSRVTSPAHPSTPPADAGPRPPSVPGRPPVPVRTTTPPSSPPAAGPLGVTTGWDPDTRTGFVRLENPGDRPVTGWRVGLDFPGPAEVTSDDATVAQDGRHVGFGGGPVPAGGARIIHYTVAGRSLRAPGGCTINGNPCP